MTTHISEMDLIEMLLGYGMAYEPADGVVEAGSPAFHTTVQPVASSAMRTLLAHGYRFAESAILTDDLFETTFQNVEASLLPEFVRIRYRHLSRRSLYFAIGYVDCSQFVQFTRPYRSFVTKLDGPDRDQLERDFLNAMDGNAGIGPFYWMPILTGSPLVHF